MASLSTRLAPLSRSCAGAVPSSVETAACLLAPSHGGVAEQIPDNWPNLEHLNMGTLDPGRQSGDEFEARILARYATAKSRYGGLKSLVVAPSHIAISSTMRMIHDHHSVTLVRFVALCEYWIRPLPVIWIMEPVRDDPTLAARDVEYSSSWVCLGSGSLRLKPRSGDMSTGEDRSNRASLPRMAMWQIQHLKKLQDLWLYLEDHSWKDSGFREYKESRIEHWESVIGTWGTLNVSDAPQAFQNLAELETLELRSMKEFINPAAPKSSRKHWKKLKWVHCN
ncbi:hypothetical protein CPC16_005066 [Podila verticillata]|nr:hypothetical protein CPC16_005066 [Podila verticillata]